MTDVVQDASSYGVQLYGVCCLVREDSIQNTGSILDHEPEYTFYCL